MDARPFLLALALFGAAAPAAHAQPGIDLRSRLSADDARDAVRAGRKRPLEALLPGIRAEIGGGLVKVEGAGERDGQPVYILRWKTGDGRLIFIEVDAETGAILSGR
ncbi:MAG: hypothetical protein EBZ50_14140 [Alphaproteobacteria bacterium]|jgi:uncharacterized membrane protein YkoI|nr:hypothetical protein [Alphaproteobacteria bacterium]